MILVISIHNDIGQSRQYFFYDLQRSALKQKLITSFAGILLFLIFAGIEGLGAKYSITTT